MVRNFFLFLLAISIAFIFTGMTTMNVVGIAGKIKIYDQLMEKYGFPNKALMKIDLRDIAKLSGHICGGTSNGFMMTKLALKSLYGNQEIPLRGDIKLTSNSKSEPAKVAAYIIGATDQSHYEVPATWIIDESIGMVPGSVAFIFERISTGKKVKLEWDKAGTLQEHTGDLPRFKQIKLATIHGCASDDEAEEFHELLKSFVTKVVRGDIDYGLETLDEGTMPPTEMNECQSCHYVCPNGTLLNRKTGGALTSITSDKNNVPININLQQNFPNPFNSSATIIFNINEAEHVDLKIYNVAGQELETLLNSTLSAGEHKIIWQPKALPSGVYFYRLQVGTFSETKKLILQK